jgi:iron(III) transport system substrate-binding protein
MNLSTARSRVLALSAALVCTTAATAADIDPQLIAKAKQEGQLVYYTDLIVDQIVRPLIQAFESKYSIKVTFTRGDSQVNSIKLLITPAVTAKAMNNWDKVFSDLFR